jgi:hypothetical protein
MATGSVDFPGVFPASLIFVAGFDAACISSGVMINGVKTISTHLLQHLQVGDLKDEFILLLTDPGDLT